MYLVLTATTICVQKGGGDLQVRSKYSKEPSVWNLNHHAIGHGVPCGTRRYDIGRELSKRGWRITEFSAVYLRQQRRPVRSQPVKAGGYSGSTEVHDGVSFIRVPALHRRDTNAMRVASMLIHMRGATRVAKGLATPDIIIGLSAHPSAACIVWWLARKVGCRYVFELRDLWPETIIEFGGAPRHYLFIMLLSRIERALVRNVDTAVTLSPNDYPYLARMGTLGRRLTATPNCTDAS